MLVFDRVLSEPRFAIGQKFVARGKNASQCEVVDIFKTFNSSGQLVRVEYVAAHDFMGQKIVDYSVCETTIARGAI